MHIVLACDANQDAEDMHIVEHVTWAANEWTDAERTQEELMTILCCQEILILVKSFFGRPNKCCYTTLGLGFAQAECRYPQSTDESWMGERPEWPFPVVAGDFGAQLWGPNSWMIGILLASETVGPKNAKQVPRWVGWQGKNRLPPFWQLEEPGFTPSTSKMEWSSFTSHHPFESQKPGCFFFFFKVTP